MLLNQKVELKVRIADLNNNYGEFVYEASEEIKARKEEKVEEVADKEGNIHRSTFEVYTYHPVKVDDLIDERLVIFAEKYVSLLGRTVMYRSLTV